ncbi:histidine phosphatase family protein [Microbaculum marinum]|uniref:Histidine phosphatase family protein n=1 Tax=Microbaculum marinum TaxID=1764581 RepID=A0AAW9S0N3_9HYPH
MRAAVLIIGLLLLLPNAARAELSEQELWAALRGGGHVVLMRHANAPGTGDPEEFRIDDCSTQRNLDNRGRLQARATGAAMRANGIETLEVRSSQWCRCAETAELLDLGPVVADPALNSFFSDRGSGAQQTAAVRDYIAEVTPGSPTRLLVTHQVNITALTKIFPASGEIVVIRPTGDGGEVLGRLGPFPR